MKLAGRKALITGAGSGLGRAIALCFAREGAAVAVNDIRREAAEHVANEVRSVGAEAMVLVADVSDSVEVRAMFEEVAARWQRLDVLVNNAGIANVDPVVQQRLVQAQMERLAGSAARTPLGITQNVTDMEWRRTLAVHLDGTFYCTREALRIMETQGSGKIVNMASVAGLGGLAGAAAYSAAKAGIIGLTKAVAREAIHAGVYVNAIAPGFIDTPLLADMAPELKRSIALQTPIGRFGTPEEVAALALYLASDDSSYTVGQVLSPNGGVYM
ncbi:MAG: beta-ketoacyl-ACP reductase [Candidatus Binatia bacterium]|nr:MAG: beta-ketoacyl-ACP reductase [Candidatus Binatia bacterium]